MKELQSKEFLISDLTTYKNIGSVKCVYCPSSQAQLKELVFKLEQENTKYLIIGKGSNLLISPKTKTAIISTKNLKSFTRFNGSTLTVSASCTLSQLYMLCKNQGLSGFEKLALIPGSLGGALKMNASCFGDSIYDHLIEVRVLRNGKIYNIKKNDIKIEYRHANIEGIILSAKFSLAPKSEKEINDTFTFCLQRRLISQPQGFSCGSVFKNPANNYAGRLIEACELKGKRIGKAQVSEKHANFIINLGGATFEDIKKLIELCQSAVYEHFNIQLETEVKIIE